MKDGGTHKEREFALFIKTEVKCGLFKRSFLYVQRLDQRADDQAFFFAGRALKIWNNVPGEI